MTMIVAAAGSAPATTPPSDRATAPPPELNVVAPSARPARLDSAISLNTPPWPASGATEAAVTLGSTEVSVLSAGAAFAATATASVNVRTGPGTQYRAIDTLSSGQRVNVTDQSGGWCEINQAGPDGWVSCRYLTADSRYRDDDSYAYDDGPDVSFQFGFGNVYPTRPYHRPHHTGWPYMNHGPSGGFGFSFGN